MNILGVGLMSTPCTCRAHCLAASPKWILLRAGSQRKWGKKWVLFIIYFFLIFTQNNVNMISNGESIYRIFRVRILISKMIKWSFEDCSCRGARLDHTWTCVSFAVYEAHILWIPRIDFAWKKSIRDWSWQESNWTSSLVGIADPRLY